MGPNYNRAMQSTETIVLHGTPLASRSARSGCSGFLARLDRCLDATERVAREVLSLPVHPGLSADDLEFIATSVTEVCRAGG